MLAAWLRWQFIVRVQPYPDEFVTLLAVKMILEKGVPVLPSGLFYEHGLLFSYAGAAASVLLGFSREVVRATSLVFSLLVILLTWHVGRRWFSQAAGLMTATLLAVAPSAVLWGGRARMYALLQLWVLLTLYFACAGAIMNRPAWRRIALVCYLGATLSQFVAIALIPPLVLGTLVTGWVAARQRGEKPWFRSRQVWLEVGGVAAVALIAFIVKRAGQPRGVAPLEATGTGVVAGIAQVVAIYGHLSTNLAESWEALAPFFIAPAAILPTALAVLAAAWAVANLVRPRPAPHAGRAGPAERDVLALFLALILALTTLEMFFFVSPERRDDKYLFMLQPALFLLAADGLSRFGNQLSKIVFRPSSNTPVISNLQSPRPEPRSRGGLISTWVVCLALVAYAWPFTSQVLADAGEDYDSAFAYVREQWREGDAILTGTPAAAAIYLGRNDYYAVRGTGGYAYRILERDGQAPLGSAGQAIERWMGSPWLQTDQEIHAALSGSRRVWLVLERWGLVKEYYSPLTMQRILAMTDFVREDNGIIVLRSRPGGPLIAQEPGIPLSVRFDDQLNLAGYDLSWEGGTSPFSHKDTKAQRKLAGYDLSWEGSARPDLQQRNLGLVLYWQALRPLPYDYTVFVHLRDSNGRNLVQADHQPLAPVYPPTLWPVGETIRERSVLTLPDDLPAGDYDVWVGVYRLDTLERLPVAGDVSGENAVLLERVAVPEEE